ncbi:hypothetical protein K439DRAFT_1621691 [Ramaria rubella]|nr:hypothetical protein K439DRAFT_1621691 [Ramaria rubella]
MAQITESAAVDHEFDDDEASSITLDERAPEDPTVLAMDQAHLDFLTTVRLLPDHGPSASDILDVYPATGLQTSLLMVGLIDLDAYIVCQNLPLRMHQDFINHPNGMMFGTVFAFNPTSKR